MINSVGKKVIKWREVECDKWRGIDSDKWRERLRVIPESSNGFW